MLSSQVQAEDLEQMNSEPVQNISTETQQSESDSDLSEKHGPQCAQAYNNSGMLAITQELYEDAIIEFTKAININSQDADFYYNRGLALSNLEKREDAIKDFDKAVELDPHFGLAYQDRGRSKALLDNHEEAVKDYDAAIKLSDEDVQLSEDIEPGEATKLGLKDHKIYFDRGMSQSILGNYTEAIDDFSKAIDINPEFAPAYGERGYAHIQLGKNNEAMVDLEAAARLLKDSGDMEKYSVTTEFINKIRLSQ